MKHPSKTSLTEALATVQYLEGRTPEMAFSGGAEKAFAEIAEYRNGAIYVGHYSGDSEWERHAEGDEVVMALDGSTTIVLRVDGAEERVRLCSNELIVVPANTWHRFEGSSGLKVMTITPQPTDHSLEVPRD